MALILLPLQLSPPMTQLALTLIMIYGFAKINYFLLHLLAIYLKRLSLVLLLHTLPLKHDKFCPRPMLIHQGATSNKFKIKSETLPNFQLNQSHIICTPLKEMKINLLCLVKVLPRGSYRCYSLWP